MRSLRVLQVRIGIDAAVYTCQHGHAKRSYGGGQRPRYVAAGLQELHMLQGIRIRMCGTDVQRAGRMRLPVWRPKDLTIMMHTLI